MIIVKIQDLPTVGGVYGTQYVRLCNSSDTTHLNETGYEVTFMNEVDSYEYNLSCKGWDCPTVYTSGSSKSAKCGTDCIVNHESRHLIRLDSNTPYGLLCDTSCENYENAYRVNKPGEKGYVIGCPNGLEALYPMPTPTTSMLVLESTSSVALTPIEPTSGSSFSLSQPTTQNPSTDTLSLSLSSILSSQVTQPSDTAVDVDKASTQLASGAIVGIIFASIAGVTILAVGVGIAGFFILNLAAKKGLAEKYSFSRTTRTNKA